MNEYEQFKLICDKIGYGIDMNLYYIPKIKEFQIWRNNDIYSEPIMVDVREIIFTQEFIDKFREYYFKNICEYESIYNRDMMLLITANTNKSCKYLYNLIK